MVTFGTGGWRAIIGDEFTKANIQILAMAMANKMKAEGLADAPMVMGYDRRFLSKETVYWSCEVFAKQGIKVLFINRSVPTPVVMFYVMQHNLPYGMMVTASHNPAIYNGVKVFTAEGRDANEETTRDIERYIAQVEEQYQGKPMPSMPYDEAKAQGLVTEFNPLNDYLDNIIDRIDMKKIRDANLHIAVDPMFGVSLTSLKTILLTARCDIDLINDAHDTLFGGHMPAPTATTLRALQTYVIDHKCDIGLATDGDGDRIGVIDDRGRYLHANDILVVLYYYLVKYKGWHGPVVRNISTTHTLDRVAESFGETCYEVPVGFKHISAKMRETDAVLGGESSGGLTVRGHINGKDGVYAAMLLVEMLAVTGEKISQILDDIRAEYGAIHMEERAYRMTPARKQEIHEILMVSRELPELSEPIDHVSYLDGCKVYFKNNGWISARFSGTEPLLRIFCEMPSEEQAVAQCKIFERYLNLNYEPET